MVAVCDHWKGSGMDVFREIRGMTEEEAKAMVEEAQPKEPALFGDEE